MCGKKLSEDRQAWHQLQNAISVDRASQEANTANVVDALQQSLLRLTRDYERLKSKCNASPTSPVVGDDDVVTVASAGRLIDAVWTDRLSNPVTYVALFDI